MSYLDMQVKMVVAVEGFNDDWAAYVENEYTRNQGNTPLAIASHGHKLNEAAAKAVFPEITHIYRH